MYGAITHSAYVNKNVQNDFALIQSKNLGNSDFLKSEVSIWLNNLERCMVRSLIAGLKNKNKLYVKKPIFKKE